ncbi:uncharacterized protein LOC132473321 [Gadus macrocephalus]|uniref:uncharacterized protein LOC132473321 n=1 Tax=Gadus macrocephalus TaxID=80720 RepID=UPI0028CB9DC8|nr:uncharacterized protein LOC132473321 [Gadus macrocephalus]
MARALKYSWTAAVYITAPSADTKGQNVISTITLNAMPRLNTEVCRGAFRKQEEKTGGKKATDKTEDQELEPGNLEDYVVLKDTIQAAAWCQLQSFKDSVSLPEVIGMEGWEQMAASTQRKSHDGGDEEETWKPFQFSFRLHTDYELFCVEMMDRRNLKVFASFESNTSPPPRPPPRDACATRLQCSLMMQHNGGAWQLWRR